MITDNKSTHLWWPVPRPLHKPEQVVLVRPQHRVRQELVGLDRSHTLLRRVLDFFEHKVLVRGRERRLDVAQLRLARDVDARPE